MPAFTSIYIVNRISHENRTGARVWFWDRSEAEEQFENWCTEFEDSHRITLHQFDLSQTIDDKLDELFASEDTDGQSDMIMLDVYDKEPAKRPEPEYTLLRNDGNYLYIERTMGGEFWSYKVNKYTTGWHVRDFTSGERIGAIYQDDPKSLMPKYEVEFHGKESGHAADLQKAVELLIELDMIYGQ